MKLRKTRAVAAACGLIISVAVGDGAFGQTRYGNTVYFERAPTMEELEAVFGGAAPPERATSRPGAGRPGTRGLGRAIIFDDKPTTSTTNTTTKASPPATRAPRQARARQPDPALPDITQPALELAIQFEFDSSALLLQDSIKLETLAGYLAKYPDKKLLIAGHADTTGSRAYNFSLSADRAASVRAYLMSAHQIGGDRFSVAGYGETRPLEGIPGGDARNRRVGFHVIQ